MRLIMESYVLVLNFTLHASFYTLFSYELGFSMHFVIMTSGLGHFGRGHLVRGH